MAASTSPPIAQLLPAERFFRVSLFLLLFTAILTLIGTGKIDLFTSLIATAAVLFRARRWWYGHEPELTSRSATFMVLCYLLFFPMDMFFVSRSLAANSLRSLLQRGHRGEHLTKQRGVDEKVILYE